MAPKKKSGKKNDDWDADMGETPDPIAAATAEAEQDGEADGESGGGGGLLAALKKNRGKKAKKGKVVEDVVEGEDPSEELADGEANGVNGSGAVEAEIAAKAPQEASMEDGDVFAALGGKKGKGKGGKGQQQAAKKEEAEADGEEDEELDETGKVKSKKEKEKEKREREKLRKKENVSVAFP